MFPRQKKIEKYIYIYILVYFMYLITYYQFFFNYYCTIQLFTLLLNKLNMFCLNFVRRKQVFQTENTIVISTYQNVFVKIVFSYHIIFSKTAAEPITIHRSSVCVTHIVRESRSNITIIISSVLLLYFQLDNTMGDCNADRLSFCLARIGARARLVIYDRQSCFCERAGAYSANVVIFYRV
jgi:hypothetical protein